MSDYTNFHDYSHADMRAMVQSMDSGGVMAASDPWRKASETLKQIRTALNTASADATSSWEGSTSDAFYGRMTKLSEAVNTAAAYANDAAMTLQMMSEAIDTAKRNMPEEPDFWDKAGDAVSDTAKSMVGTDDEDTRTGIADERKAQAVAVMQTLSAQYRSATTYLKPPPPRYMHDENTDLPPSGNPTGAEAIAALIMGGGFGGAGGGGGGGGGGSATVARSPSPGKSTSLQAPKVASTGPTDAGIKGGTANPAPRPKGPGTGLDGIQGGTAVPGTGTRGGGLGGTAIGGGGGTGGSGGIGEGGIGGGIGRGGTGSLKGGSSANVIGAGRAGTGGLGQGGGSRAGSAFGAGGMGGGHGAGGAGGAGGASAGRGGSGLVRKGGGVVGESTRGGTGGRAFSEGGSGLGRSRGGQAGQGAGGQGHGAPGGSQAGKKDKKQGKDRPDYLVEDEETWASGEHVNPNVVE